MQKKIKKEFLGEEFHFTTQVEKGSGKFLWNKEIDMKFNKWLSDLRHKNRELFKVQYSISKNGYEVLERLKEIIGVYDDSLLVRAITITYINYVDTRDGKTVLNKLKQREDQNNFKMVTSGKSIKKNLYFSPVGMRDLESYSKLTGLKKSHVIQNCLYTILLISINEEPNIKRFWDKIRG